METGIIKSHYDWIVVGSGLFGAVFTDELLKSGKSVLVVERRKNTGGNIRCDMYNGVLMHTYGAHIFHTNSKKIWDYVNRWTPLKPITHSPMARTDDGRMFSLPFNMHTFTALWPWLSTPADAQKMIDGQTAKWREKYPHPRNLEERALTLVGEDIYDLLIKGYTAKQWNMGCEELPPEIISRVPLRFSWDTSYFDDYYVGIPLKGYNPLIEGLLDGADIITGVDYINERKELERIASKILYTGCIDEYFGYSLGKLGYRSLRFDTKIEPLEKTQGCSVVNYTGLDAPWTRVIEHNQFAPKAYEELVKSYEYPADYKPGAEPYYPIINEENRGLYRKYETLAKTNPNVVFGGRLGMYEYMDMDDAIERALQLSRYILK